MIFDARFKDAAHSFSINKFRWCLTIEFFVLDLLFFYAFIFRDISREWLSFHFTLSGLRFDDAAYFEMLSI